MKRLLLLAGLGLLGLGITAGCHTPVNTVAVGDSQGTGYQWIKGQSDLSDICRVTSARKERVNGLLKVQVEVFNDHAHQERFVYKIQWLDANGMEISSVSNDWVAQVINGRESVTISGIAPDPRVTDARVKMQENVR